MSKLERTTTPLIFHKQQESGYDLTLVAPPTTSPFTRTRMSSSVKRKSTASSHSSRSISSTEDCAITYFTSHAYTESGGTPGSGSGHSSDHIFKISEENPYCDMFRVSINACKKCKGNGIIIPKGKNEPIICPKCSGHGYANDDIIMSDIKACGRCLVM